MKLFAIQATGNYGGGWALVRAKDELQAREMASKINDKMWHTRYDRPQLVFELPSKGGGVLYHYEIGE